MRISELARRAGVTTKAVRYYESLGLLAPGRLANGYRDYGEHELRLTREVSALGALGIPARRTRPFLDCLAVGHRHADDCPASLAAYRDAIDDLTRRIEGLAARREALTARLEEAAHRGGRVVPEGPGKGREVEFPEPPADLPVPEDDGAADRLPGAGLPRLELRGTGGGTTRLDALGAGRTVLYVYPLTGRADLDLPEGWDSIPGAHGCTAEACGFRDHHRELLDAGAAGVFGLSSQGADYQRELAERLHLPFPVLSDPTLCLARVLGLPTFEAGGLRLYRRLTLVVRGGVVEHVFYPVFPPGDHAEQVLAWLRDNPVPEQ
ncbi:peroxiredoxin [Actinopolyspora erythraea]|uniref:Peroxiredoxin n=1 Tax=Actinopolyspora erythraea TaxID=414996 RepID=A0A099DC20_9ACTN|nr:MerR family DNA-binding transcriptional regulator [Actinopolyspora erythraea]ASU76993.1 peroxiredoxin [Actinopolyspora erythraea]KGI82940.1 peroxiredoxin [Actinopolyspora erythraea]